MVEWLILAGVGAGAAGLVFSNLRSSGQRKAEFAALLAKQEWSWAPTHPEAGLLDKVDRGWGFYGQSSKGVDWEVYLVRRHKSPSELCYRAVALKLPQLELLVGKKADLGKLKEALPQIEKLANSFIGKMVMAMAEKHSSQVGATPRGLLDFLKEAEEKSLGSPQFQSRYSVITRGTVPIENVLTPEAQRIIEGWSDRHFHLSWGPQGLAFHLRASSSQAFQFGPEMVRLGDLLTGGAG
ncbi:hypothetical protein JST97_19390 [bacterium]|nr:hypothetical protein [bacterium]